MMNFANCIAAGLGWVIFCILACAVIKRVVQVFFELISKSYCKHKDKLYLEQCKKIRSLTLEIDLIQSTRNCEKLMMTKDIDKVKDLIKRAVGCYCPHGVPLSYVANQKEFDAIMHDLWAFIEENKNEDDKK